MGGLPAPGRAELRRPQLTRAESPAHQPAARTEVGADQQSLMLALDPRRRVSVSDGGVHSAPRGRFGEAGRAAARLGASPWKSPLGSSTGAGLKIDQTSFAF